LIISLHRVLVILYQFVILYIVQY